MGKSLIIARSRNGSGRNGHSRNGNGIVKNGNGHARNGNGHARNGNGHAKNGNGRSLTPSEQAQEVKNYMTPQGYARLKVELTKLLDVERPDLVKTISWAASNGD